jgi:lipopolysaccharide/colanic/teichoic acid biosynthesis glycosyltransferase
MKFFTLAFPVRIFTLFLTEIALLLACYVAAAYVDPDVTDVATFFEYEGGILRVGLVVLILLLGFFFRNMYAEVRMGNRLELFRNLSFVFGLAFVGEGLISYLVHDWMLPRKVMLIGSGLAAVFLFANRAIFDVAARSMTAARRVLFLGMSTTEARLVEHFGEHPDLGLNAIGFLETEAAVQTSSASRLGALSDLDGVMEGFHPTSVVLGRRDDIKPRWVDSFLELHYGGVRVEEASNLYEGVFRRKCVTEMWPSRLIFSSHLEPNRLNVLIQTLYSWVIAWALLVVLSPLLLALVLWIKMISPGSPFESETRTGRHGATFALYRFRRRDNAGVETAPGRFIARFHLNFLPALWNVLKGDMVLIGPRPESPAFVERLTETIPFYQLRHAVRPGLTGWAGVHLSGAIRDSLGELEYDLYYIENLSVMLDLYILMRTLKSVWIFPDEVIAEVAP